MNDALCEHIVARKSKPMDFVIRILIIVVIVAIAIGGMPFLGFFAFALAMAAATAAFFGSSAVGFSSVFSTALSVVFVTTVSP